MAEQDDPLLLFFTLNGSLVGVSQQSGTIRWQQNDGNNCLIILENQFVTHYIFLYFRASSQCLLKCLTSAYRFVADQNVYSLYIIILCCLLLYDIIT